MKFSLGHNNKCHIYRSVGGSAIYIIMLYILHFFPYMLTLDCISDSWCQTNKSLCLTILLTNSVKHLCSGQNVCKK